MVVIEQNIAEQVNQYCQTKLPEEACGALIGFMKNGEVHVNGFIPISNRASDPITSFYFDAKEWVELVVNPELTIIGTFHSHPTATAYPSQSDLNNSWPSFFVNLILAMETGEMFAYAQTKNHPIANGEAEWFNGLDIRINPRA